jgi:hypothetical protein
VSESNRMRCKGGKEKRIVVGKRATVKESERNVLSLSACDRIYGWMILDICSKKYE